MLLDAPNIWKPNLQAQWGVKENQIKFLKDFAENKHFDPLISENWYSVSYSDISSKVAKSEEWKHKKN